MYAGTVAGTVGLGLSVPVELLKSRAQMQKDSNLSASQEIRLIL